LLDGGEERVEIEVRDDHPPRPEAPLVGAVVRAYGLCPCVRLRWWQSAVRRPLTSRGVFRSCRRLPRRALSRPRSSPDAWSSACGDNGSSLAPARVLLLLSRRGGRRARARPRA